MDKRIVAVFVWVALALVGAALIAVGAGRAWMLASYPSDALVAVGILGAAAGFCVFWMWLYFVGVRIAMVMGRVGLEERR